ncbi:hypothetical protein RJ639_039952 [Escallonia herrerae]|uniref:Uncharacterized protein n=1 Tax=Escallonia herrerae TaxID=1293975 RepID=A0AA88WLT3_9ASTE|nr:hypothetical protein RJ639_039952 [Escallonia herrerae]
MNPERNPDAELAYGEENVNPMKAADRGYDTETLQPLTRNNSTYSQETSGTVQDLKMPFFTVSITVSKPIMRVFHITVTNVGFPVSAYRAVVTTLLEKYDFVYTCAEINLELKY